MLHLSRFWKILLILLLLVVMTVTCSTAVLANETPEHLWAMAASAVRTEWDHDRHDVFGFGELTPELVDRHINGFKQRFGIDNREELIVFLDWLALEGHRRGFDRMGWLVSRMNDGQYQALVEQVKDDYNDSRRLPLVRAYYQEFGNKSIKAWDFCRYIYMCRSGYTCGYFTEQEAWDRIMPVARMLRRTFDSWDDLSFNYQVGRQFYCPHQTSASAPFTTYICFKLKYSPESPWQKVPWETPMPENLALRAMQPLIDFVGIIRNRFFPPAPASESNTDA